MDGKGYLTPDPPDPPDTVCITVYVPNHRLYIGAFWGAYQFFTTWTAWARDPLKKGKRAAAVWLEAFQRARARWDITQGRCDDMITGIRSDPLDDCKLQMQSDGGPWVTFFDASCCGGGGGGCGGGKLRLNGSTIERYNSETGKWEPAGPETPPSSFTVVPPPYPPSSDGACLAATNFASLIQARKTLFGEVVGGAVSFGDAVLQVYDLILTFVSFAYLLSIIGELLSGLYTSVALQYAQVITYDLEDLARCMAYKHYASDGTMSQGGVDGLLQDIQDYIDDLADPNEFEGTSWRYVYSWVKAAGPEGMAMAATFQGLTTGDCSECPGVQLFDFTQSDCGWVPGDHIPGAGSAYKGIYIPGQGWALETYTGPFGPGRVMQIYKPLRPTLITKVKVEYIGETDGNPALDAHFSAGDQGHATDFPSPIEQGLHTVEDSVAWTPPVAINNAAIAGVALTPSNPPEGYQILIRKIWYYYVGPNGFVAPLAPSGE